MRILRGPDVLVEPAQAAVERVRPVVGRELELLAVKGEAATGNPVGIAAGDATEVGQVVPLDVIVDGCKAEYDVAHAPVAVRHEHRLNDAAVGMECGFD